MSPRSREEMQAMVQAVVAAKIQRLPEEIPLDASFASLGFESMDTFDILFALEDQFNLNLPDDKARAIDSMAGLLDCMAEELKL